MAIAGSLVVTVTARTQDFEAGMRKTTATLKFTEQQAAQVANAFGKLGDSFTSVGTKASRTSSAMQDLKGSLLGLAAGILSFQALRSAIEGSVQAALKLEALQTAFKVITGSAQGAAEAMQFVRDTGERLGVQIDSISTGYKTLLAATQGTSMSLKEAQTLFLGVVEASRALGLSADDTAGALRPLTQIISQQAFQADELRNEFGSRVPGSMQMLVTASNGAFKSVGELTKAMEDGKLKGQAALDLAANFGVVLRQKFAPAASAAAKGTQAAFESLRRTIYDMSTAFGSALAPALAEAARALTAFIGDGKQGAKTLGEELLPLIRQLTSLVIGLGGAFVVTGKAIAAFSVGLIGDTEAARIGWQDVFTTIKDFSDLQQKVLSGGFAQQPGAPGAAPDDKLKGFKPGGGEDGKKATKTAAERESERIAERQKDLVTEIANAYDAANAAIETGVELERTRMEQQLRAAKFSEADLGTLMATYDATQKLLETKKADEKLAQDRLQLSTQLQESLDKQVYTERELLSRKLTALGFSKEEAAVKLKMFDTETRLREEAEKRTEAEKEALQATKDHLEAIKRLQDQLQPRLRRTRAEELQDTISELAGETTDPFALAQADIQRLKTLDLEDMEDQLKRLEDLGESVFGHLGEFVEEFVFKGKLNFKDMMDSIAQDLFRFAAQTLMQEATKKGGWLEVGLDLGMKALNTYLGVSGGMPTSGTLPTTEAAYAAQSAAGRFSGRQHGGPVMPGKFYTVGERGPELFTTGTGGTIIPNGQGVGTSTVVNVHVSGVQDAQSFVQSRGAVSRAMMGALAQARQQM